VSPPVHDPTIIHRHDGRWEIRCPECQRSHGEPTPLGIGMPITGEFEARCIKENHARATGPLPRHRIA
jgi:hypothetical protein